MRANPIVVLTQEKEDNAGLAEMLAIHNIDTIDYPCIATRFMEIDSSKKIDGYGLCDFPLYIFTSKRGVNSLAHLRDLFVDLDAEYASVGETTAQSVEEVLGVKCRIRSGFEHTGLGLAKAILSEIQPPSLALHIRGDKTTGDLKRELETNGWHVSELISYENLSPEIFPLVNSMYNAAVFASPSAVIRFFSINPSMKSSLKCVAIGNTTFECLQAAGIEHVYISAQPNKNELVTTIVNVVSVILE